MKHSLLIPFVLLFCLVSFAQSTDLDKENFTVSYVKLPSEPILDDTQRTFSSNSNAFSISGFSKVKAPGTLDITYRFKGTNSGEVDIEKIKHEKKDDDGNVVSTSYTYKAKATFSSSGVINVINASTGDSYSKGFGDSSSYESKQFDSYYKAESHYRNNKYDLRNTYGSQHKGNIKSSARSYLNKRYGYTPYTTKFEHLWILGSKKHPEFQKHHEAFNKVKAAFEKMKYDEPMDEIKKEIEPVIEYFNGIIPNYPGTKRKMRKVKYASYYNIAKLYYYLDMPEKAKEYAQKIIENDYDKGDGKHFNKISDRLLESFEINKTRTRHMKILTEDISNIPDEEEADEQKPAAAPGIEVNQAYLITKKGDTTLVDIKTEDIVKIGYDLKIVAYDNNKSPIGTRVKPAKNCKELVFVDGLHYRNIKFKESAIKGDAVDAGQMVLGGATDKICKVLYESDKINLYIFNNKELVILPTGAEKGKSTLGTSFVFGFKKNLSKFAEGCPAVIEKAKNKGYKNTQKSLLEFCNELTACEVGK